MVISYASGKEGSGTKLASFPALSVVIKCSLFSKSQHLRLCDCVLPPFLTLLPPSPPLSFHQSIGDWESPDGVRCKVDTQLYLVCPDHTHKENHKAIPVNNKNQESCMDMWVDSQVLEFGSLLRGCRVEVPRPGTYSLTTDC